MVEYLISILICFILQVMLFKRAEKIMNDKEFLTFMKKALFILLFIPGANVVFTFTIFFVINIANPAFCFFKRLNIDKIYNLDFFKKGKNI